MTTEAYIFEALRTPRGRGRSNGGLFEVKPVRLLAGLLERLAETCNLDRWPVDDVIMGCVTPTGEQGANIAKTAVMLAGWPEQVAGVQVNRFCASGLEAVHMAAAGVRSGWQHLVVAGGVESMSRVAMGSDQGPWMMDPETSLVTKFVPQGVSADLIATREGFSRQQVDEFAWESQQKASYAQNNGLLKSLVPVCDLNGFLILDQDQHLRPETTMAGLAQLKPAFQALGDYGFDAVARQRYPELERIDHVHTPGNSSGIVDGAAAVVVGSKQAGQALGLKPRARIVAAAVTATEPTIMLTGPAPATAKALKLAGLSASEIDLYEVNEAFAAVVLKFARDLAVPLAKINVNGGAIAWGHPLGATGAMLVGTLLDELERRDLRTGVVTLCVGGGMGIASVLERM